LKQRIESIKCFIASAFGHKEIDEIYKFHISKILRDLKVVPQRVDKINHNEKIDSKIIELINNCHFGIADLTFARPSVYYEAGLLEGMGKNVIYLSRKDHFIPKEADINGNERIHFDLSTKNIIQWGASNSNFDTKLNSRVKLILKSIPTKQIADVVDLKTINEFQNLSISERITICKKLIQNFILDKKLIHKEMRFFRDIYTKRNKVVSIIIQNKITGSEISYLRNSAHELSNGYTKNLIRIVVILSKIQTKTIINSLHFYKPISANIFEHKTVRYIFIDNIESELGLSKKLSELKI
jgi:hypothetical protein